MIKIKYQLKQNILGENPNNHGGLVKMGQKQSGRGNRRGKLNKDKKPRKGEKKKSKITVDLEKIDLAVKKISRVRSYEMAATVLKRLKRDEAVEALRVLMGSSHEDERNKGASLSGWLAGRFGATNANPQDAAFFQAVVKHLPQK